MSEFYRNLIERAEVSLIDDCHIAHGVIWINIYSLKAYQPFSANLMSSERLGALLIIFIDTLVCLVGVVRQG